MGIIDEFANEIQTCSDTFDNHLSLVDKYMEMASDEYDQKIESADLRYLKERGSDCADDTLNFLYEEAEDGLNVKAAKAVDKAKMSTSQFLTGVKAKVAKFSKSVCSDGALDSISDSINTNPFLKKAKAKFVCSQAFKSNGYDKIADNVVKTAMKGGTVEDIKNLESQFKAMLKRRADVSIEMSLPKMVEELKDCGDKMDEELLEIQAACDKATIALANIKVEDGKKNKAVSKASILVQKIFKQKAAETVAYYIAEFNALKKAIKNAKKAKKNPEPNPSAVKESVFEQTTEVADEMDAYLKAMFEGFKEDTRESLEETGIFSMDDGSGFESFVDQELASILGESAEDDEDLKEFSSGLEDLIQTYLNR